MKRGLFFFILVFIFIRLPGQPVISLHHLDQEFHVASLKRDFNPYENVLPQNFKYSFSWEKSLLRSIAYQPAIESYYHWDNPSSSWMPDYEFDHTYNLDGKLLTTNQYNYSSASESVLTARSTFSYDAFGFLSENVEQILNQANRQLVNLQRDEQQHTISGNTLLEQISLWDMTQNNWYYNHNHRYSYDDQDREILIVHSNWDVDENMWYPYEEYFSSYDSAGNFIRYLGLGWNDSLTEWQTQSLDSIQYDNNHHRIHEQLFLVPFGESELAPFIAYDYSYNANGNLTQVVTRFWNLTNHQFQNNTQTIFTFSEKGLLSQSTSQLWDVSASSWKNNDRSSFMYDEHDMLAGEVIAAWTGTQWMNSYQYIYTNDENGNEVESIGQSWNNNLQAWINVERYTASYLTFTGNETDFMKNRFSFHPNPVSNYLFIENLQPGYSVILTSEEGKSLKQSRNSSGTLNVSDIESGNYFLVIKNEKGEIILSKKIIILR